MLSLPHTLVGATDHLKGPRGYAGDKGDLGPQGQKGEMGYQGMKGAKGNQGKDNIHMYQ